MMNPEEIIRLLNQHLKNILANAELAIPTERQFSAFRKQFLHELGADGFQKDLCDLFEKEKEKGRNIHAGKEVS